MMNPPLTKQVATVYVYNQWSGNIQGTQYKSECCAYEVWDRWLGYQCARRPGKGPAALYCAQHARIVTEQYLVQLQEPKL